MTDSFPQVGRAERTETLSDQTYRLVKTWMLKSGVQPHTKVTERGLAEDLGVSRTPLREVLRVLEHERLLERTAKGQLVVASLSLEDIRQIHECRMRIETLAARQAATNGSDSDVERLRKSVAEAWVAYAEKRDDVLVTCNTDFHQAIYVAARNPWLALVATPLQNQMFRIRVQLTEAHHSPVWRDEHESILNSISSKDADSAEEAMQKHIESDLALHLAAAEKSELFAPI